MESEVDLIKLPPTANPKSVESCFGQSVTPFV